jgi:MOSC domain-containing protein YiiM
MEGRIIALNLAVPRTFSYRGRDVLTGIYKVTVAHPIRLEPNGVVGDTVADLRVHGGPDKAAYAYPGEHYPWWREQLGPLPPESPWGVFGENLTTEGLVEDRVFVGDRFQAGEALLEVSQPRQPCFKFIHKMNTPRASLLMIDSGRCGIYFRVLTPGDVRTGDRLIRVHEERHRISVRELNNLLKPGQHDLSRLRTMLDVPQLAASWREMVREELQAAGRDDV